ncbi:MAG: hypothetical protein NTV42_06890 [Chloroflexi bacterium]|nr:hypothetical protein [Chloroflexota bacterium]
METLNYLKHVIRKAANYTFSRITFYLTLFNFFMLASWMYDNTSIGEWMKDNNLRAGDMLAIILFAIFFISAMEYVIIGRDREEEGY